MRLTKAIIEKAKTNAEMTGEARLILSSPDGYTYDTDDTALARHNAKKSRHTIEAVVRPDGMVDRVKPKAKRKRRPK